MQLSLVVICYPFALHGDESGMLMLHSGANGVIRSSDMNHALLLTALSFIISAQIFILDRDFGSSSCLVR